MMENMVFHSWIDLLRSVVVGVVVYLGLIFMLRVSGKRTLSKWNQFDFVVTVAFGSTFATVLLSKQVSIADGIVALGLLIFLQFVVTWLSVRSGAFQRMVKAQPTIIFRNGQFLEKALKKTRVTKMEVEAAIRAQGHSRFSDIGAVVLESDGSFSVIADIADLDDSTLRNVEGFKEFEK